MTGAKNVRPCNATSGKTPTMCAVPWKQHEYCRDLLLSFPNSEALDA
jgi:hypothetical protein